MFESRVLWKVFESKLEGPWSDIQVNSSRMGEEEQSIQGIDGES
jgi:hypothetical protein